MKNSNLNNLKTYFKNSLKTYVFPALYLTAIFPYEPVSLRPIQHVLLFQKKISGD